MEGISEDGWNALYCNEMAMPFASNADTSMFPPYEWSTSENDDWCLTSYGEHP